MKTYLSILICVLLLAGCGAKEVRDDTIMLPRKSTLTHKAYKYYGLSEQKNRAELKTLLGVDPVETEWCAAFINSILDNQGIPSSATVSSNPLTAKSFLEWGEEVFEPMQGDIIVFPRGNEGWQGHVGFFVSAKIIDGIEVYYILGGNQNNSVSIGSYSSHTALSIRRFQSL